MTVTGWKVVLSFSGSNNGWYGSGSSTGTTINAGSKATLTATVTGPAGKLENAKVKFETKDETIALLDNNSTDTQVTKPVTTTSGNWGSSSATTGTATVDVYGGTMGGYVDITATVMVGETAVNLTTNPDATATITPYINGPEGWTVSLPENQRTLTIKKTDNTQYLKPTATGLSGSTQPEFVYKFVNGASLSDYSDYMQIASNGRITPRKTCQNIVVRVYVKGYTGDTNPYAETSITITDSTANSVSIDYKNESTKFKMNNGTYVLACKDTNNGTDVVFTDGTEIVTALTLKATVDSTNATADAKRVTWTTNAPEVARFGVNNSYTGDEATLTTTGAGSVTVTAEVDGKKATMNFVVWQAREYDQIVTKPDIPTAISSREDAFNAFSQQYVTVHLSRTDGTVSLPMKNVQFVSSSTIQLKGWIDGFDSLNRIAYFPKSGVSDVITSGEAKLSNIMIINQPQDATYKLNATVGTLSVTASTQNGKSLTSFTWYDNNDKAIKAETVSNKVTYTSTLNLSDFVTSAGTYGFYCVINGSDSSTIKTRTAIITIGGDYNVKITPSASSVKPGDTVTLNAVPQQYNPARKTYTDVTGKTYTVSWTVTEGSDVVTLNSRTGSSVTLTAKSGGTATITAETTIDGNKYTGTQKITVTVPAAEDVRLTLEEDATYVMLDGGKLSDAVKKATSTTPSTFSFTLPTTGTIYSSSSLSSSISAGNKYSASDVSRMAFKPSRSAGSYTIDYAAYGTSGQIATGKLVIMTNAGTVAYHISANESQTMQVSDFQSVYGSGLSSVKFGTASDSRGALYKGSSTSSGKVGSESYYVSTGTTLLKNVTFIAGSSTAKYSVVIPFTAYGSNGEANGNLVIYVNDTHSVYSTGATFKSMAIADELAPESNASSAYITITSVVGGKLYTQYSKINSCTALAAKDLGSTRFSFSGSNSIDNLYVLPLADSKTVEVNYTINGSDKGTLTFKVMQQTASSRFTDVSGSFKWAANSVDFMSGNGLVNGISTKNPNVFGPGQNMTRAMLVTILYRAAGEPSVAGITNKFTDNKQNQYYYEPVLWASSKGIVNGATATTFDPDGKITREQIAAILYRYAGSPAASSSALNGFADQSAVSSYAVTAMQWAVGNGIITGVSTNGRTTLSAKNNATRAQVSVMLHRFLTMEQ
ncbi:MAG: S-layer homology domain-containing protein [Clostridiales bacterium]|nr:S-layer homology domain-containing protein [Clostridiales bacterium]